MAQVKLILREDVEKLGDAGDVVSVKPGYARNFLLPKGKASLATEARINELEHHRRIIAEEQAKLLKDLEGARTRIESQHLEIAMQAGTEGKLFGSVTMQQVAELLAERGIELDRRKLSVAEPIKTVGEHSVNVRLHREMSASLKLTVVSSGAPPPAVDDTADEDASLGTPAADSADETGSADSSDDE